MYRPLSTLFLAAFVCVNGQAQDAWKRHVIDDSWRGADGVRLADFNGDGRQDVVTGWEQSGVVRLYLNPGFDKATQHWPAVTVGTAPSPEDAVPFDVDGDGQLEVVSCHEGKTRRVLVHRHDSGDWLTADSWTSNAFEKIDRQMWMFAEPMTLGDSDRGIVVGSKGNGASITLLIAPKSDPGNLANWHVHRLRDAGWIMTLKSMDFDGDGDDDVVYSDRKGNQRAVGWLEQPNESPTKGWTDHVLGVTEQEAMFIDASTSRILVATRDSIFIDFRRRQDGLWRSTNQPNPDGVPFGKAIKLLADGSIVMSSNTDADKQANPKQPGLWVRGSQKKWSIIDPTPAVKFDRLEALDLDGDGDQDVMTCEERKNLGVIWYENPAKK